MQRLVRFIYSIFNDSTDLSGEASDFARGSFNLMPLGLRQYRPFRNLLASGAGARRMFQIKDGWGGLDDAVNPATGIAQPASGSLFSTIADILVYIGHGQVSVDGASIPGAIATSLLRLLLKWNGSYTDAQSGPFTVGLIEPSAPEVGVLDTIIGGTPTTKGTYSFRAARLRGATGGKSRASQISKILTLNGKAAYLVAPLAATGQTVHPFFVTTAGLGGIGLHFRIPNANPHTNLEYTEDDIDRVVSTLEVTNGSPTVSSSVAAFTQADVGKRFSPAAGATFSVPNPTTVLSINEAGTSLTLSNPVTIASGANPRAAHLIAFTKNIDRAVVLNWKESDLAGEAAEISWIYDFPPPSASHAFQLASRLAVVTHADSRAEASATNNGTALLFSLPNQLESFDLRFPLYLPGGFVDVLNRGIDSYSFIGCRNGIYAVQFVNSDTIPATISVLLANEGIATPNNWAISKRWIYLCTGDGKLTRTGEGGAQDSLFYEPIRRYIAHWTQANTVITTDPKNDGTVFAQLGEVFYLDEQTGRWSTPLYLRDSAAGNVIAGIGARSELFLTVESGDVRSAYKFDRGTGSFVVGTSPYVAAGGENNMLVQQISTKFVADDTDKNAYVALHRNNLNTYLTDGTIAAGTNFLNSAAAQFSNEYLGAHVLVKGAGAGGGWQWARIIGIVSPNQIALGTPTEDLNNSVPQNAINAVTETYVLIALQIFPVRANRLGTIQAQSPELFFSGCHSIAASILLETTGEAAHPMEIEISGDASGERWDNPVSAWGGSV